MLFLMKIYLFERHENSINLQTGFTEVYSLDFDIGKSDNEVWNLIQVKLYNDLIEQSKQLCSLG